MVFSDTITPQSGDGNKVTWWYFSSGSHSIILLVKLPGGKLVNWCCTVEQCESACKALWGLLATRGERKAADIFHFLLFSSPAAPQPVSWLAPQ